MPQATAVEPLSMDRVAWPPEPAASRHGRSKVIYLPTAQLQTPTPRLLGDFQSSMDITPSAVRNSLDEIRESASAEQKFRRLAEQWRSETLLLSSATAITTHPSYLKIIGMGPAVVPILLRELQDNPDEWFTALSIITEEDPIDPTDAGRFDAAREAWIGWGKQHAIISSDD